MKYLALLYFDFPSSPSPGDITCTFIDILTFHLYINLLMPAQKPSLFDYFGIGTLE